MARVLYESQNFVPLHPENEVTTESTHGTYETNKEAVGQTDDENRSDLFRMHLLRRCGLIERK